MDVCVRAKRAALTLEGSAERLHLKVTMTPIVPSHPLSHATFLEEYALRRES
jgi:hypothetical protein